MAHLEDITVGCSVSGITGGNAVEIVAVKWFGTAAIEVTYKNSAGQAGKECMVVATGVDAKRVRAKLDVSWIHMRATWQNADFSA